MSLQEATPYPLILFPLFVWHDISLDNVAFVLYILFLNCFILPAEPLLPDCSFWQVNNCYCKIKVYKLYGVKFQQN